MKIAFHAPLKSPDHPVPSGDRQMARMLIEALRLAGHDVGIASELRTFSREASDAAFSAFRREPKGRSHGLGGLAVERGSPTSGFATTRTTRLRISLVPRSRRSSPFHTLLPRVLFRSAQPGAWKLAQDEVAAGARQAAVNICFTHRDARRPRRGGTRSALCALLAPSSMCRPFRDLRRTGAGRQPLLAVRDGCVRRQDG